MPKVDPSSGEPMSDAPDQDAEVGGGRTADDPDLPEGSNPTGSGGPTQVGRGSGQTGGDK